MNPFFWGRGVFGFLFLFHKLHKWAQVGVWLQIGCSYVIFFFYFFFLRGDADLFAKLQVLQQNVAYFSASAQTVADPAISKYSGQYCGSACTVDSLFISRSSNQGRLLSLFALT